MLVPKRALLPAAASLLPPLPLENPKVFFPLPLATDPEFPLALPIDFEPFIHLPLRTYVLVGRMTRNYARRNFIV